MSPFLQNVWNEHWRDRIKTSGYQGLRKEEDGRKQLLNGHKVIPGVDENVLELDVIFVHCEYIKDNWNIHS